MNPETGKNEPRAAVALIRVQNPEPAFLVIRRAANPKDPWSGHFSLPGGRRERDDLDLLATCRRETREEVGFDLAEEHFIRPLPLALAGSAIGNPTPVQPYLFEVKHKPDLVLLSAEVASAHWVEEGYLLDPDNHVFAPMLPQVPDRKFPGIPLADYFIWGFTYGILGDFFGDFPRR